VKIAAAVVWLAALALAYAVGASTPAAVVGIESLDRALGQRSPLQRSLGLSGFLLGLNPSNIDATLERVEGQAYWFDQRDYELLFDAWVRFDSPAAVDWALARPALLKHQAGFALIRVLGFHNPAAARSLLEAVEPGRRDAMFYAMVDGWARSGHVEGLTSYLSKLRDGENRQRATAALARMILSDGVNALVGWVDQVPTEAGFKRLAFAKSADAIARIDPRRAAEWVDEHLGNPYASTAPSVVSRRWFERDPAATMDWLIRLPEASGRNPGAEGAFRKWIKSSPKQARAWVMASTPNRAIDPMIRELVRQEFRSDRASAMDWAHRIDDPAQRLEAQVAAGRSWYQQNPESFMEWLPESGLESQARALILNHGAGDRPAGGDSIESPGLQSESATIDLGP
jgi:hypothetical protein